MDYNITYREKDKGLQAIISYKDNTGKWKQKSKQGFENSRIGKSKAKEWVKNTLAELEGTIKLNKDLKDITFGEFVEMYYEDKKKIVSQNTAFSYLQALKRFKSLYNIKLRDIKNIDIQKCISDMRLSTDSLKTTITVVNGCLRAAVNDYEILSQNPIKKITYTKVPPKEKKALTSSELDDLLSKLKGNNLYIASLLAGKCGLRAGEILGLTWDCIDREKCIITINKQWKIINYADKPVYGFGKPKSLKSYRDVIVNKDVINKIFELKPKVIELDNKIVKYKNTMSFCTMAKKRYKNLGFDVSIHELRHTYATLLIGGGMDFKTAAELLGHDVKQTIETYSHVTDEMRDKAKGLIDKIF